MTNILTQQQQADAQILAGHKATAARADALNKAEQARHDGYSRDMARAVAEQGAPSQAGTPGEGIRQTADTSREIARQQQAADRVGALSPFEALEIANNARHGLMRAALAAGKNLPTDHELQSVQRAAVDAARSVRLGK